MLAVLLTGHGGHDRLDIRTDVAVPEPGAGEVRIAVGASAVNATDINTRVGWYSGGGWTGGFHFPRIQGIDACGRIVAVGDGVDTGRIGERVLVEPCWREPGAAVSTARFLGSEVDGAFAEYLVCPARHAHRVESPLDDIELASLPCSWSTAENLLSRTSVGVDDRVLVTGASGGVGSAVVCLAAARGAEVIAVAAADKLRSVAGMGAAMVVDRAGDLAATVGTDSVDVVIDLVGGDRWPTLLSVLRPGGRVGVAGAIGGPIVELDLRTLYLKDLTLSGCTVLDDGVFERLVRRIHAGEVRPVVADVYDLHDIVPAQRAFERHRHVGKIVLRVAN